MKTLRNSDIVSEDEIEELEEELDGIDMSDELTKQVLDSYEEFRKYSINKEKSIEKSLEKVASKHDISVAQLKNNQRDEKIDIDDIDEDEEFITLEAQVAEIWEPKHDAITSVGLLSDDTGTVKFISFEEDTPVLIEGNSYRFSPVVTDEYDGDYSVKLLSNDSVETQVEKIDKEFEQSTDTEELNGFIVKLNKGSGLIDRCVQCNRVLKGGQCDEHGNVEGEFDMRLKLMVDNGEEVHEIICNSEITEQLTGMDIETAVDIAKETMNRNDVKNQLENELILEHVTVQVTEIDGTLVAEDVYMNTQGDNK